MRCLGGIFELTQDGVEFLKHTSSGLGLLGFCMCGSHLFAWWQCTVEVAYEFFCCDFAVPIEINRSHQSSVLLFCPSTVFVALLAPCLAHLHQFVRFDES